MRNKEDNMDSVIDYLDLVQAPWGRMFYDLLYAQLPMPDAPALKILDFGSGLGLVSNHFAARHDVTAIEPNPEMIQNRRKDNPYAQIQGGIEKLIDFDDLFFDVIFCHNVLEYIENKEPVLAGLFRVLKPGGLLSVVKHNRAGKVIHNAVFCNDPNSALALLDEDANSANAYLGTQHLYTNGDMAAWAAKFDSKIIKILGMRAFWALGQDNAVKYNGEWYQAMLKLETRAAEVEAYRNAAYFNHLLVHKERTFSERKRADAWSAL